MKGRKVTDLIFFLVNEEGLNLLNARFLHEDILLPELIYSSETIVGNKMYISKKQPVQTNNLREC